MFEHERTIEITREEAPWAPEEELGTYKLKRWTWFEKQRSMAESTIILDAKKGLGQGDTTEYFKRMIWRTVIESPLHKNEKGKEIGWTPERVGILDVQVGDLLMQGCRDLNGLTWEEQQDFLGRSDSEEDTSG